MKRTGFFILMCFSILSFGQKKKDIEKMPSVKPPMNGELIEYTMSVTTKLPDSVVYKRALHWYKNEIKSMRVQDKECIPKEKIVGKAEMQLLGPSDSKGVQANKGRLKYTMSTEIDGSTFTVHIQEVNLSNSVYTPIEPWITSQEEDYMHKYYLMYIQEQIDEIFASMKEFVNVEMVSK